LQSITSPHVIDRHVTKITTKTTSKNTAAEASNDINGKSEYFFAAAAVKKENKKNTFNNEIINQPPKAESLITEGLTEQQKIYLDRQLSMLNFDDLTTQRLAKEIEAGLIDPHCFIKTGNDFYRKINAIIKSVKIGQWTPPASLQQRHYEEKEKQTNQKQREIHALWLAWNQAINHVYSLKRDLAAAKTAAYYPALVQQHDQAASHLKAVQAQILMHCPDTNFNQIQKEVEEKFYA
jgi:hypothetical protein